MTPRAPHSQRCCRLLATLSGLLLTSCVAANTPRAVYVDVPSDDPVTVQAAAFPPAAPAAPVAATPINPSMSESDYVACSRRKSKMMQTCKNISDSSAQMGSDDAHLAQVMAACLRNQRYDEVRCE